MYDAKTWHYVQRLVAAICILGVMFLYLYQMWKTGQPPALHKSLIYGTVLLGFSVLYLINLPSFSHKIKYSDYSDEVDQH
ncbi:MAG: hypothetical protein Alpg2KO_09900 [Alphaproteobacteria bacterium]